MKRHKILILLLIIFQISSFAESRNTTIQTDTFVIHDTVLIVQETPYSETINNYQEILAKTNEQLSLWWNPYIMIISILSVFFTVLTIIAAIVIFRQSKESKKLIEDSMSAHKSALDSLINEKQKQFTLYETSVNNLILELTEKSTSVDNAKKLQIEEVILRLEEQKRSIDTHINTYKHSGWREQDIPVNYIIDDNTNLLAKIYLADIKQEFVIYLRIRASNQKIYWIGFAGNIQNNNSSTPQEYTRHQLYNSKEIIIQENIMSAFNLGFEKLNIYAVEVNRVRLRGSDKNTSEISFEFKIF